MRRVSIIEYLRQTVGIFNACTERQYQKFLTFIQNVDSDWNAEKASIYIFACSEGFGTKDIEYMLINRGWNMM